jgi:hypothetical protein
MTLDVTEARLTTEDGHVVEARLERLARYRMNTHVGMEGEHEARGNPGRRCLAR